MNKDMSHLPALRRVTEEFGDASALLRSHDRLVAYIRNLYSRLGANGTRYSVTRYTIVDTDKDGKLENREVCVNIGEICRNLEKLVYEDDRRRYRHISCDAPVDNVGGKFRTGGGSGPKTKAGKDGG